MNDDPIPVESTGGGFTEFTSEVISALGYLPLWGQQYVLFKSQEFTLC